MGNVGSCFTDITIHFSHNTDVLVTVQEGMLLVPDIAGSPSMRGFVCFQAGIGQDNDEPLRIFVGRKDWDMLICNKLGQFWRWT